MNIERARECLRETAELLGRIETLQDWRSEESLEQVVERLASAERLLREVNAFFGESNDLPPDLRDAANDVRAHARAVKALVEAGLAYSQASADRVLVSRAGYTAEGAPAAEFPATVTLEG